MPENVLENLSNVLNEVKELQEQNNKLVTENEKLKKELHVYQKVFSKIEELAEVVKKGSIKEETKPQVENKLTKENRKKNG